jgi:hypothetical protein
LDSIRSTINSINSSLLNEIKSYKSAQATGSSASTNVAPSTSAATSDSVNFSQVAQLFQQLHQLQSSDPAEFKQILTDAAAKFKDAATQQTDPSAAQFLSNIASRFQTAADTGNLAALQSGSSQEGGPRAHHGHHRHPTADDDQSSSSTPNTTPGPTTPPATSVQDLATSLLTSGSVASSQNSQQVQQVLASLLTAGS